MLTPHVRLLYLPHREYYYSNSLYIDFTLYKGRNPVLRIFINRPN